MKLKCIYIAEYAKCADFTVGKEYEVIKEYPNSLIFGYTYYEVCNDCGYFVKVGLDNLKMQFEIVDEGEREDMKKMLTGLEAIELMKQGKIVVDATGKYHFKIIDGNVCYKYYTKDDDEYAIDCAFEFSTTYKEYIESKPLTGWEKLDEGETYHLISGREIYGCLDNKVHYDDLYYERANYFSTKEKAEEINFKQTLFRKLQRFSDENGGLDIDWNDGSQTKWSIYYSYGYKEMVVDDCWQTREFGQVFFSSKEVAEEAVELFHDDLIKYFTM